MFVRDPFSRLWSAYIDKLFLPDFWSEIGVPAVRKIRGPNATAQARKCGNDVTFAEFVEYSLTSSEPHYDPIYKRCDPCQYRPTVIGTMETFARDSLFLLRRMGLEWVLKDVDHQEQQEKELTTLVDYNFERVSSRSFYLPCVTDERLAELLWAAFQFNGYIPQDVPYKGAGREFSKEDFKSEVVRTFRQSQSRKSELKQQKKQIMKDAFGKLPKTLIEKIEAKYEPDIRYFGFSKYSLQ
nr:hypothetical protein BaRGS_006770 [Batillaria attramentaria]